MYLYLNISLVEEIFTNNLKEILVSFAMQKLLKLDKVYCA